MKMTRNGATFHIRQSQIPMQFQVTSDCLAHGVKLKHFFRAIRNLEMTVEQLEQDFGGYFAGITTLMGEINQSDINLEAVIVRYTNVYSKAPDKPSEFQYCIGWDEHHAHSILWSLLLDWMGRQSSVLSVCGVWNYQEETGEVFFEGYDGGQKFTVSEHDTPEIQAMTHAYFFGENDDPVHDLYDIPLICLKKLNNT